MAIQNQDVTAIAQSIFRASGEVQTGRTTYLRTLLAATQDEMGKKRGLDAPAQLAALKTVHERFYEIVLKAAEEFVPKGTKERAVALHTRANFARTSLSALRSHVRAGGDLATLSAAKVTKAALNVRAGPQRALTPRRWKVRAERESKRLVATLLGLADTDKAAAIEEIQLVMGQLTTQLVSMGLVSTKDAAQSMSEHRPLRIGKVLFMPTATQVIQQQARPS